MQTTICFYCAIFCRIAYYVFCCLLNIYYYYYNRFTALWTLSGTTRVSQYQKGKTNLDFTEARDTGWQWHQLGHMQICISPQT